MTEPTQGWGLRINRTNGKGFIISRIFGTRKEAIDFYDAIYTKPDRYRIERRKGMILAVRVTLSESVKQPKG